jgi:hypothetical protein
MNISRGIAGIVAVSANIMLSVSENSEVSIIQSMISGKIADRLDLLIAWQKHFHLWRGMLMN